MSDQTYFFHLPIFPTKHSIVLKSRPSPPALSPPALSPPLQLTTSKELLILAHCWIQLDKNRSLYAKNTKQKLSLNHFHLTMSIKCARTFQNRKLDTIFIWWYHRMKGRLREEEKRGRTQTMSFVRPFSNISKRDISYSQGARRHLARTQELREGSLPSFRGVRSDSGAWQEFGVSSGGAQSPDSGPCSHSPPGLNP